MSGEAIVSVNRGSAHTLILPNVPVLLEDISPIVIAASNGMIPKNTFWLATRMGQPDIQTKDLLTDIVTGDQYRVSGRVMKIDVSYLRMMVQQDVGT